MIELTELVGHVQALVPKLAAQLGGEGQAAVAASEPVFGQQTPRFGSHGEDFVVVNRLVSLPSSSAGSLPLPNASTPARRPVRPIKKMAPDWRTEIFRQ
jgi:hypothetical protein